MPSLIELVLDAAIKESGDIEDVRLSKEDARYILKLLSEYRLIRETAEALRNDLQRKSKGGNDCENAPNERD